MKILVTGDLHLGRRPARLPEEAREDSRLGTDAVWLALVETALARGVDVVALTGDVVDRDNRFFEALGPLERGLRRLAAAGVDLVAVGGNHDFDVLPHLADQLASPRFHLLGRGGRWERLRLERPGGEALAFDGWSFPDRQFAADPLASYDLREDERLAAVGLLHAEVGAAASPYAPTSPGRLRAQPVVAWLLGHVHAPGLVAGEGPPLLYAGSLQPLGLGEPGVHGPWILELRGRRVERLEQLPFARLRYEEVRVDAAGARSRADLEGPAAGALRRRLAAAEAEGGGHLRWLVARLVLTGRAALGSGFADFARGVRVDRPTAGDAAAAVVEVADRTLPPYDLHRLAAARDPPGVLAAALLHLQEGGERELAREAAARLSQVHDATAYGRLAGLAPPPGDAEARDLLLRSGYRLLEALLAQKAPGPEAP